MHHNMVLVSAFSFSCPIGLFAEGALFSFFPGEFSVSLPYFIIYVKI